jgi:DNA modification methylase
MIEVADNSVSAIVTSPPYWRLRDYGNKDQIGQEKTPEEFIEKLVSVFRSAKRTLNNNGTLWVNIGDGYATGAAHQKQEATKSGKRNELITGNKITGGLKPKDLVGIPWMLAFALRADGWYLRQEIIWSKPNPMPESVKDRCTRSHEYIFMLSKSPKYYYDAEAIKTEPKYYGVTGMEQNGYKDAKKFNGKHSDKQSGHSKRHAGFNERWDNLMKAEQQSMKANKRSVWTVPTKPFAEAHFATFPPELIVDIIKCSSPENGLILDPFMGAGTTALVAKKLNRNFIGYELNQSYIDIANSRMKQELGLFY